MTSSVEEGIWVVVTVTVAEAVWSSFRVNKERPALFLLLSLCVSLATSLVVCNSGLFCFGVHTDDVVLGFSLVNREQSV